MRGRGGGETSVPRHPAVEGNAGDKKKKKKKKKMLKKKGSDEGRERNLVQDMDPTGAKSVLSALSASYSSYIADGGGDTAFPTELAIEEGNLSLLPPAEGGPKSLVKQICQAHPSWKKEMSRLCDRGAPLWVILCPSADRCIAVLKDLADLRRSAKVRRERCSEARALTSRLTFASLFWLSSGQFGKLFSRHMKVPEQVSFLQRSVVHVAVGTPARILKLCSLGSLKLTHLKVRPFSLSLSLCFGRAAPLMVLTRLLPCHAHHSTSKVLFFDKTVDVKQRNLLSLRDVQKDLWTLYTTHVESLLEKGQVRVSLI